ncbi:MAG: FixH family protein [Pseudomonadota bacterium]
MRRQSPTAADAAPLGPAMLEDPHDYTPRGRPITGPKVLLIILLFFGVIIAANGTMMYYALSNFSGLVVKNSYVASQTFEEDQARFRASPIKSWAIDPRTDGESVELHVRDADGAPVEGLQLSGVFGRRSHDREDRPIHFDEIAPGLYLALVGPNPSLDPEAEPQGPARGAFRLRLRDAATPDVARRIDMGAWGRRMGTATPAAPS